MATTPEGRVKQAVVKQLKMFGEDLYYFFPATGGYGKSGVPDIMGCVNGRMFAIECKAGKGVPTALQNREIHRINMSKGVAWVVNESNIDSVVDTIQQLANM